MGAFKSMSVTEHGYGNTYICPLLACRNLTLKPFIEGHPQTAKVPHRDHFLAFLEIFSCLMLIILH